MKFKEKKTVSLEHNKFNDREIKTREQNSIDKKTSQVQY